MTPRADGLKCDALLEKASSEVGPHNVYNLYDNCPGFDAALADALERTGKSMRWLKKALRAQMLPGAAPNPELDELQTLVSAGHRPAAATATVDARGEVGFTGGYVWSCGGMGATSKWITSDETRAALHLKTPGRSRFGYSTSGPASVTLWPFLATRLRVLIYNGDADGCVPYKGNVEWIGDLETAGSLAEKDSWRPWFTASSKSNGARLPPAGYVSTYSVPSAPKLDFSFVTIRLAGHMVPTFQPAASLAFFERFLAGKPF